MTMLASQIAFASSHAGDPAKAMAEVAGQLGEEPLAGMLLFCSHRFDREALARAVNPRTEGVVAIGCTSSGELTENGYDEDSLSVVGFPASAFHMTSLCFDDIENFDPAAARQAVRGLAARSSEEHTSELQSLMRISYAVFCLK